MLGLRGFRAKGSKSGFRALWHGILQKKTCLSPAGSGVRVRVEQFMFYLGCDYPKP